MPAKKGNQWWKLRAKHGRDKIFKTPEMLWESCVEYFEYTDTRVLKRKDWVGKDAERVDREYSVPYTMTGLCLFLDVNTQYFYQFKKELEGKEDDESKDFSLVITRIEEIIYTNKFEGATLNLFNANIIARDLGLSDKKETTHKGLKLGVAFEEEMED